MWQAKTIKEIVKCEFWLPPCAREENQWCFTRWFIDLPLLWLQGTPSSRFGGKSSRSAGWVAMTRTRLGLIPLLCSRWRFHVGKHCLSLTLIRCSPLCSHQCRSLVPQITCKSSTGPMWWSTRGPCPTRRQRPSHGCRSRWPAERRFRPSCWLVRFPHSSYCVCGFFFSSNCFLSWLFRSELMDQTRWWGVD